LCPKGKSFTIPKLAAHDSIYHEVELGVMMKTGGRTYKPKDYLNDIGAYFLLIDYTDSSLSKEAQQ
jgi:2-keto-4-pentenoate hydratase/2-oxohepta-3-ene-1,7-dioic acid hydratase in catechol pathway